MYRCFTKVKDFESMIGATDTMDDLFNDFRLLLSPKEFIKFHEIRVYVLDEIGSPSVLYIPGSSCQSLSMRRRFIGRFTDDGNSLGKVVWEKCR